MSCQLYVAFTQLLSNKRAEKYIGRYFSWNRFTICKIPIKWPTWMVGWADSLKVIFFKGLKMKILASLQLMRNPSVTPMELSFLLQHRRGVHNTSINKRCDRAKALLIADAVPSNEINLKRSNCGNTSHMLEQENHAEYSSYVSTVKETLTAFCHPVHNQSHCIIHPNVLRS